MAVDSGKVSEYTGKSLADVVPEGQLYELNKFTVQLVYGSYRLLSVTFAVILFAVQVQRYFMHHITPTDYHDFV